MCVKEGRAATVLVCICVDLDAAAKSTFEPFVPLSIAAVGGMMFLVDLVDHAAMQREF